MQQESPPQRALYDCSVCYTTNESCFAWLFYFSKIFLMGVRPREQQNISLKHSLLSMPFFSPWINTNASAYIQFKKYMYISCFKWVHNDTQLPFEMWQYTSMFNTDLKVVLWAFCQCFFFFLFFLSSSQISRFYRKRFLYIYSSLQEQAITLSSSFMKRDR